MRVMNKLVQERKVACNILYVCIKLIYLLITKCIWDMRMLFCMKIATHTHIRIRWFYWRAIICDVLQEHIITVTTQSLYDRTSDWLDNSIPLLFSDHSNIYTTVVLLLMQKNMIFWIQFILLAKKTSLNWWQFWCILGGLIRGGPLCTETGPKYQIWHQDCSEQEITVIQICISIKHIFLIFKR